MGAVSRHFENVNIRAAAYIFPLGIFVFYVLAFVGSLSDSPGIPGIYLLKLVDTKSKVEVRIGYFGMCAITPDSLTCASTFMTSPLKVFASFPAALLALLPLAQTIQTKVAIFAPLLLGAILFLCSFLALLELKRRLKSSRGGGKFGGGGGGGGSPTLLKTLRSATVMLTVYSLAAAAAAAAGATAALLALRAVGNGSSSGVEVVGGTAMLVLLWLVVVFGVLSHFVVSMMFGVRGEVEAAGSGVGGGEFGGGFGGGFGGREESIYD